MKRLLCAILLTASASAQTPPAKGAAAGAGTTAGTTAGQTAAPAKADAAGTAAAASKTARPAASAPSPKDLKYPALHAIRIPKPESFTLPNGIKVRLVEDHELPEVQGTALIRTGSAFDPPERIGLAQMTGLLLRNGGTALKTGEQIDTLLEQIGASLDASIGETTGAVRFQTLKENSETVLLLLKEVLAQPAFRQDKLDAARAQLRGAISRRYANPATIAHHEFTNLVFGKETPYGWEQQYSTVDRISRNDLRAFHERYFFPANLTLGITGDFDSAQLKKFLESLFADWTPRQPAVPEFPKVRNIAAPGVYLADRKELTQSYFSVGHLGGQLDGKEYAALEVLCNALRTRLLDRFRKMSNGSEINTYWAADYAHPGVFEIAGAVKSVSSYETIKAVQQEVEAVRSAELPEEDFVIARDRVLQKLGFLFDTRTEILDHMLQFEYYGFPVDYAPQLQKAIQSLTRAELMRVAKQAINPANFTIVVAGNSAMFGDPLERLGGPVAKLDLTIPEPKPEVVTSTDVSLAEGKQTLAKAQTAAGGADKLAAIKDYTMLAEYQIDPAVPNMGGSKIVQTDRWISPTLFRQDAIFPSGRVSAYTDGRIGWISTPQGWGALAGTQRNQVFGDLFRVYFRLLLSDRLEGRTVNGLGPDNVQITDAAGQVATVGFDAATGLPRRVTYDTAQAGGPPIFCEDVYEDFRDVGGIQLPFKITIHQGGRNFSEVTVKEYKLNGGIKPLELGRRPQ